MRQEHVAGFIVSGLVMLLANSQTACAQDPIHKAGRGLGNVLTCWIEVPKNLHLGTQEDNPLTGAGWGLIKGIGLGVTRLVVGAYEAVTFPIPVPRDYASPYEGLELSDYAWE